MFYEEAIANVLQLVAGTPGFLAGESLIDVERPGHYLVITRWSNREAWLRWFDSHQRREFLDTIQPFLLTDEKYTQLRNLYPRRSR